MPTEWNRLLKRLSKVELQKLLHAKTEIEDLEARRAVLKKELAAIEKDLDRLTSGDTGRGRRGAKKTGRVAGRKKSPSKAAVRTRSAKKAKKKAKIEARAPARKAVQGSAAVRRSKSKPAKAAPAAGKRMTLEDVVASILAQCGEPMPFKVLLERIVKGELFASRSKNFENVLRRTLSTSKRIKRLGRGIYGL